MIAVNACHFHQTYYQRSGNQSAYQYARQYDYCGHVDSPKDVAVTFYYNIHNRNQA